MKGGLKMVIQKRFVVFNHGLIKKVLEIFILNFL